MKSIIIASLIALAIAASPALERTFSPKTEYVYKFDGLLLSGLPTTDSDASQTRISCRARLQAVDDRYVHLQLNDVKYFSANLPQADQWPKTELFEQSELPEQLQQLLELPVRAQIRNGLISEIQFSNEDAEWSKNAKRSILNLFSLRKSAPVDEMIEEEQMSQLEKDDQFYTVNEKTMEGDCQVAYTIVKEEEKTIYTKSVNFDKCITRPETAYGLRFESDCKECEKEQQLVKPQTVYTYTFKNEKLEQAEVHSVYTINVNGQEIVKSETRSKLILVEERKMNKEIKKVTGPKEEIIYSMANEQLMEEFYQKGDKVEVNPFEVVLTEQKMEQLQDIFRQIQEHKQNTPETVHLIARAVRLFRMCTIEELKQIHTAIYVKAEKKVQYVMDSTLAIAGTKNTIQHLIHHFVKKTITPLRAAELLKSIQETLYPSEHIADLLIELAQSPLAQKYEPLRQSAWLAAGSVVRGFASQTHDLPLARPTTRQLKEKFVRVFMQHFRNAESTYEKILAIKALGNAGLDLSVYELTQLIQDPRQPLAIRTEAVDALRLLKDIMPRKIQKVLLPVYKNRQNQPELRMAALWRMMHTLPEEPVLAHIVAQMEKESNQHVAAFTYQVIRQFSKNTIPCYQPLAVRCSKVLLFTRYQPQEQILSIYSQLPLFNYELLSGVQFDFTTIFEKNAYLPKEIQASLETLGGGNWNKYLAQVGFSQQNFEQVIQKAIEKLSSFGKQTDSIRARRVSSGVQMLQELAKKMNIRPRVQTSNSRDAHAVFYLRYKEMDFIVLPLDMETLDNLLEKYVRNGELDIKSIFAFFNNDAEFELHRALYFRENVRRFPTTIGVPLTISGKVPTILSINGKASFELKKLGAQVTLDIVPSVASTHITEMRFWYPMFEQGVKTLQSVRIHTPMKIESTVELKKNTFEITHKLIVPENQKTIVAVHTRPVAFIRISREQEYVEAEEKTIFHPQLQMTSQEVDRQYEVLGLKVNAQGNVVSQWTLPTLFMTEQDFEYTLENKNRPAEFVARLTVGNLEKTDLSEIKFDKVFEKEFDLENTDSENRREYFHKMIRQIQSEQGWKHLISFKVEAPQQFYFNTELRTVCDQSVRMCKWEMDCRRSPVAEENKEWTLRTEFLAARPQMPSSLRQLREQPHREVQLSLNAKWGSSKKSEITVNAQLEQSKEQKKYVRNMEREFNGLPEYELLIKAARLNQINAVSEYRFTPETEYTFSRIFDLIKAYNFWTVSEKRVENEERRVVLQLTVEPMSRQYVNLTLETPQQQVELKNMRIPRVFLPTIAHRAMTNQVWEKVGTTCKVDQSEVFTFDRVNFRAPLTTCFSLIAKDCSEEPTFAVLAKKMNKKTEELLVKIVRHSEEIVVKKTDEGFLVKVDDEKVQNTQAELKLYNIEILGDNLIVIRIPQGEVRFDGYTVKTILPSVASQNQLCGLCGNNDGETDNEYMTADNYETKDVEEFHRSYLLKDQECEVENDRISEKKNYRNKWNREEKEELQYEQNYDEETTETKMVKKTLVKEFSHRVCFSLEPVTECTRGSEPEKNSTKKLRFTCLPRHSNNARRFLKESRDQILDLADFPVSYVEAIQMPTACVAY